MRMKNLHGAAYSADAVRVRELLESGVNPNERDERGYTPLLWAALRAAVGHQIPVVIALLQAGADPNAMTEGGDSTVLMWAVQSGNRDVVSCLIDRGALVNQAANEVTPLMVAAQEGNEDMVRLLLDRGADPFAQAGRFTAADYAEYRGHEVVARALRASRVVSA